MRALQLKAFQTEPEVVELPDPEPGPGQVVIKVGGAGLCHSDLHVMHEFTAEMGAPWGPPFVLGHENAGWVHELGAGVTGLEVGERRRGVRPARLRTLRPVHVRRRELLRPRLRGTARASASGSTAGSPSTCSCPTRGTSCRSVTSIRSSRHR